jgi:hypothetical protein
MLVARVQHIPPLLIHGGLNAQKIKTLRSETANFADSAIKHFYHIEHASPSLASIQVSVRVFIGLDHVARVGME